MTSDDARDPNPPDAVDGPIGEPADDTTGHSFGNYEYARQHVREHAREADEWAAKQAVRKQAKSRLDRLRGR